jgi:hypothetical protein
VGGVGDFFKRLFGGDGGDRPSSDGGVYIRVRCDACGEVVQARLNPSAELSLAEDGQSYFVRKVLVGQRCFRPIEVQLRYADQGGRDEISRDIRGGTSVEAD